MSTPDTDIVVEAREFLADISSCGLRPLVARRLLNALVDEVVRLREQFSEGRRAFKNNDAEWWQQFER